MTPEQLQAWLQANGLTGGPESDPYNLGDGGGRATLGNSTLARREDESQEQFLQRAYQMAMGSNGQWGTAGRGLNDLQNEGFVNSLGAVDVGGTQYHRVGENIADPTFRERLIRNVPKADNITKFFDQYDPASVSKYDPTHGWLMQKDKYDELVRAMDSTKSEGVFADTGPVYAFGQTIGRAMGISSLIAGALQMVAANAATFGAEAASQATSILSTAGATGGGYQSLASTLAEHAAANGGSLTNILNTVTGGALSNGSLVGDFPDAPWGVNAREALPGMDWGQIYEEYGLPETFNGTLGDLRDIISPKMLQTLAPAGGAALNLGKTSMWSNLLSGLSDPKNLIPVAGQVFGAVTGASAARDAARIQGEAAGQAISEQRRQFDVTQQNIAPWLKAGTLAIGSLAEDTFGPNSKFTRPFSMSDIDKDPVYQKSMQFGLSEGTKAIDRMASASGRLLSGRTAKELSRYATDYTGTKANDSFNRYQTTLTNDFNRKAAISGVGQTAANTVAASGSNMANNVSNLIVGNGNAQAASNIAQGNAVTGAINNLGNWWQNQQLLSNLPMYRMS